MGTPFDSHEFWGGIRTKYEARLQWELEQGLDPVELRHHEDELFIEQVRAEVEPRKPRQPLRKKVVTDRSGIGGAEQAYDRAQIVRLYEAGNTAPQIAACLGCNKQTVYTALNAAGVKRRDDRIKKKGATQ